VDAINDFVVLCWPQVLKLTSPKLVLSELMLVPIFLILLRGSSIVALALFFLLILGYQSELKLERKVPISFF
jgi:hypothetical protein